MSPLAECWKSAVQEEGRLQAKELPSGKQVPYPEKALLQLPTTSSSGGHPLLPPLNLTPWVLPVNQGQSQRLNLTRFSSKGLEAQAILLQD